MTWVWVGLAVFSISLVGAFIGFDLAFRVTAYRTRQIVLREIDADAVWRAGYYDDGRSLKQQRIERAVSRREGIILGCREDTGV